MMVMLTFPPESLPVGAIEFGADQEANQWQEGNEYGRVDREYAAFGGGRVPHTLWTYEWGKVSEQTTHVNRRLSGMAHGV